MATNLMGSIVNGEENSRDTLLMMSGVAMIVFGAGLILSNPVVRRYLSQVGAGNIAQTFLPDVERYFRLRSM